MKNILLIGTAIAAIAGTPVFAQTNAAFTGVRVEVSAGVADVRNDFDVNEFEYAGTLGYDVALGDRFTLGLEGTATNLFDNDGREYGAGARLGYAVNANTLWFARAGYASLEDAGRRTLDGLDLGAGVEGRLTENTRVKFQYNYTDFERDVGSHGLHVGLGYRF